jgi:hypothetical protein
VIYDRERIFVCLSSQSEQTDRIGPKPPGLPEKRINPDPDYEVIDFSSQQYSNAAPVKATKDIMQRNPAEVGLKCELCGTIGPVIKCEQCVKNLFCYTCDDMFHRHPKRQNHLRKVKRTLMFKIFISFILIFPSHTARRARQCSSSIASKIVSAASSASPASTAQPKKLSVESDAREKRPGMPSVLSKPISSSKHCEETLAVNIN